MQFLNAIYWVYSQTNLHVPWSKRRERVSILGDGYQSIITGLHLIGIRYLQWDDHIILTNPVISFIISRYTWSALYTLFVWGVNWVNSP